MDFSSSSIRNWTNIVYISFRGEDCRKGFFSHLRKALSDKGIKTFQDHTELRGQEIGPTLLEAIENSMILIIVFTKNYASSTWCLDELVKMMECRKKGKMVVAIFLDVEPKDVRMPSDGVFGAAFSSHCHNVKVDTWKDTMTAAANIGGFHLENFSSESLLIEEVVADILEKLDKQTPSGNTNKYVGIDSQIGKIKKLLSSDATLDTIRFIGIVGMGGIGKTTLAKVLYKQISGEFDACSFLTGEETPERPGGLVKRLLSELLKGKKIVTNTTFISDTCYAMQLRQLKVLVVLDNVNGLKQWEDLIGQMDKSLLGWGSRVIITSRDKKKLQTICNDDHIWEVEKLSRSDATQLFCKHAFHKDFPNEGFEDVLASMLDYAGGNPMALKVLGSSLYGESECKWKSSLERMRKGVHSNINKVLKISFDGLEKEEQEIFLHIACFFVNEDRWSVMKYVLDSCGLSTEIGLTVLKNKCLLEDNPYGSGFKMHDLLREMGRLIVRQQDRSRTILDLEHMQEVIDKDSVSEDVEGIALNLMDFTHDYCLLLKALAKMPNLKFLKYYSLPELPKSDKLQIPNRLGYLSKKLRLLHWESYPFKQLPAQFLPGNLVQLKIPFSKIERSWEGIWNVKNGMLS